LDFAILTSRALGRNHDSFSRFNTDESLCFNYTVGFPLPVSVLCSTVSGPPVPGRRKRRSRVCNPWRSGCPDPAPLRKQCPGRRPAVRARKRSPPARSPNSTRHAARQSPAYRANPYPEVTNPACRIPLRYFGLCARDCSSWRPDADSVRTPRGDTQIRDPHTAFLGQRKEEANTLNNQYAL
jgi:hypothetical protein